MASAAISATFWRLPFESARTFLRTSSWKRFDQRLAVGAIGGTVEVGQELEGLLACQVWPQERLASYIGSAPVGPDRFAPGVDAEELAVAGARLMQPEQQADRGGLAGAVGAEVAVDLARIDREVEVVERHGVSVVLAQPHSPDRG